MDSKQLTANLKFIFSSFGGFLASRWATKNYGSKIHVDYGESALSTGIAVAVISSAKKISDPQIGLGLIAGTGMNAAWSYASIPAIKSKLPDSIQATLGSEMGESGNGNSLDGYSDYELMGNERVINIAREMADHEKEAYQKALISAVKNQQRQLPQETVMTVGSGTLQQTFQTGLEGEEDLDGDSLNS
jgi:hypothetical protein